MTWIIVGSGVLFGILLLVLRPPRRLRRALACWCGWHDKEYLGIKEDDLHACCDGVAYHDGCRTGCDTTERECSYEHGSFAVQVLRWACRRCPEMGQDNQLRPEVNGYWKIENGAAVPDRKRWANWEEPE